MLEEIGPSNNYTLQNFLIILLIQGALLNRLKSFVLGEWVSKQVSVEGNVVFLDVLDRVVLEEGKTRFDFKEELHFLVVVL